MSLLLLFQGAAFVPAGPFGSAEGGLSLAASGEGAAGLTGSGEGSSATTGSAE